MTMTPRLLFAVMMAIVMGMLLAFVLPAPAHAKCKVISPLCQGPDCPEPRCITTSDGGPNRENIYSDDRKRAVRARMRAHYQRPAKWKDPRDGDPWEGTDYDTAEGRARRAQQGRDSWRNDGQTVQGLPGKISPFVPGSTQDLAWKEERRRRGVQ